VTDSSATSYRLGYARVSTLEQDPALQHDALKAAGVERIFTDQASGSLTGRPQLSAVLEQLRPGDTLVVWRLDRLGRSTSHLIQTVTALEERGIGFASLTEAIDTTTPAGRLLFGVLASLAAFERDLIRERTLAGLAAARARGRVGGRPSSMTADKLAVARRMLAEGRSKSATAATIGVSRATLYAHLGRLAGDPSTEE
jgi:DNA invertase Pin-like site-specific DNA recombinase